MYYLGKVLALPLSRGNCFLAECNIMSTCVTDILLSTHCEIVWNKKGQSNSKTCKTNHFAGLNKFCAWMVFLAKAGAFWMSTQYFSHICSPPPLYCQSHREGDTLFQLVTALTAMPPLLVIRNLVSAPGCCEVVRCALASTGYVINKLPPHVAHLLLWQQNHSKHKVCLFGWLQNLLRNMLRTQHI